RVGAINGAGALVGDDGGASVDGDLVVRLLAAEDRRVITGAAVECIVAAAGNERVVTAAALDEVVELGAEDGVVVRIRALVGQVHAIGPEPIDRDAALHGIVVVVGPMFADNVVPIVDDFDLAGVVAVGVDSGGHGDGVNPAVRSRHTDDIAGLHLVLP